MTSPATPPTPLTLPLREPVACSCNSRCERFSGRARRRASRRGGRSCEGPSGPRSRVEYSVGSVETHHRVKVVAIGNLQERARKLDQVGGCGLLSDIAYSASPTALRASAWS